MRLFDYFIVIIAAAFSFASAIFVYGGAGGEKYLLIESEDTAGKKIQSIYPLSRDAVFSGLGPLGESVIEVRNGKAFFVSSPCKNKICVAAGALSRAGEFSACLPNRVLITIEGKRDGEIDALVR